MGHIRPIASISLFSLSDGNVCCEHKIIITGHFHAAAAPGLFTAGRGASLLLQICSEDSDSLVYRDSIVLYLKGSQSQLNVESGCHSGVLRQEGKDGVMHPKQRDEEQGGFSQPSKGKPFRETQSETSHEITQMMQRPSEHETFTFNVSIARSVGARWISSAALNVRSEAALPAL